MGKMPQPISGGTLAIFSDAQSWQMKFRSSILQKNITMLL